jgi:tripartite-type tricarboxylate transporter receptor subunit TctC
MRLITLVLAALLALPALPAASQTFPNRPVRIVVPYAAGGEHVATSPADGYTLALTTIAHNGTSLLYKNLRYDPSTDLQPVILVAESPSVLMVNAAVPAQNPGELLALARQKPGELTYGSAGNGSAMHMAAELLKHLGKVDLVHVPYRGAAPAMADLLSGRITLVLDSVGTAHQHLKGGKIRALAVTSPARNPSLPDVPTLAEAGVPGYASMPWYALSTAKGVPADAMAKLNAELNAALKSPDLAQRWETLGVLPLGGSPEDAVRRNCAETERWSAVIRAAWLSAE